MNTIENKKIAIVGGGPGGLTLARILQNRGAAVKVYERDADSEARPKGATLDLHYESGLKAIIEAGLMDEFKANYRPGADKLRIVDQHANIVFVVKGHDQFQDGSFPFLRFPERHDKNKRKTYTRKSSVAALGNSVIFI